MRVARWTVLGGHSVDWYAASCSLDTAENHGCGSNASGKSPRRSNNKILPRLACLIAIEVGEAKTFLPLYSKKEKESNTLFLDKYYIAEKKEKAQAFSTHTHTKQGAMNFCIQFYNFCFVYIMQFVDFCIIRVLFFYWEPEASPEVRILLLGVRVANSICYHCWKFPNYGESIGMQFKAH